MKIAIIHYNLLPPGGISRFLPSMAQPLKALGHKVTVFTNELNKANYPKLWERLEVKVIPLSKSFAETVGGEGMFGKISRRLARNRLYAEAAKRIFENMDQGFDALFCMNEAYKVGYLYKEKNPKTKNIWIMFDPPFRYRPKGKLVLDFVTKINALFEERLERKWYMASERVVVLDKTNKEIAENFGLPATIVRSGVDFGHFYSPVREISQKFFFTLLGVGSLSPFRRFEDIIQTAAILRKTGFDARVLLICKDLWGKGEYRKMLLDLVNQFGMKDFVTFRFDGASEEEMPKLFGECDIFVFPNTERIWGMAVLEAMAAGLPVVASRSTSVAEFLANTEAALFSDPANPESIADAVKDLINNPRKYQEIASQGQELVRNQLSWQAYAEKILEIANSL